MNIFLFQIFCSVFCCVAFYLLEKERGNKLDLHILEIVGIVGLIPFIGSILATISGVLLIYVFVGKLLHFKI